eukprot:7672403-Prorocentrum_lima.AAC.1
MTSSLVGSEMCIRDRYCSSVVVPPWLPGRTWPYVVPLQTGRVLKTSYPVSYTHLTLPTICSV